MTHLPLTRSELLSICEAELTAARNPAPAESSDSLAARAVKIERKPSRTGRGTRVWYYLPGNRIEVRYE